MFFTRTQLDSSTITHSIKINKYMTKTLNKNNYKNLPQITAAVMVNVYVEKGMTMHITKMGKDVKNNLTYFFVLKFGRSPFSVSASVLNLELEKIKLSENRNRTFQRQFRYYSTDVLSLRIVDTCSQITKSN